MSFSQKILSTMRMIPSCKEQIAWSFIHANSCQLQTYRNFRHEKAYLLKVVIDDLELLTVWLHLQGCRDRLMFHMRVEGDIGMLKLEATPHMMIHLKSHGISPG